MHKSFYADGGVSDLMNAPPLGVTRRLLLREASGARPALAGTNGRLFTTVLPRLQLPLSSCVRDAPKLATCVLLGFSRCGRFLLSYAFDSELQFTLYVWLLSPAPLAGSAWSSPRGVGPR